MGPVLLLALLGVGAPAVDAVAGEQPRARLLRVAVSELQGDGIEPRQAAIVSEALLLELRKRSGVSVLALEEVRAMIELEAQKQTLGCAGDGSCLAEIVDALGADVVVVATATVVGDGSVFGLKRLEPKSAQARQVTRRLERAGGEELLAAIGPAVDELFAEHPLRPGQVSGVEPELALRINPPPLPPWVFWTTTVAAGALAVATVGAGAAHLSARTTFSVQGAADIVDGAALKQTEGVIAGSALGFWVGVGATSVVVAAAGVEALFVDWRGHRE